MGFNFFSSFLYFLATIYLPLSCKLPINVIVGRFSIMGKVYLNGGNQMLMHAIC